MTFTIGQHVEVKSEQGHWTKAVIREINTWKLYRVMYPAGIKIRGTGRTTTTDVEGTHWWPASRIRAR